MEEKSTPSIVRIAFKYGVFQGVVSIVWLIAWTMTGMKRNWMLNVIGSTPLIVLMILTHQEIKKTHASLMRYSQGLGSGTLLSSVGGAMMSIFIYAYTKYIDTGYIAAVIHARQTVLEQQGLAVQQAHRSAVLAFAAVTPTGLARGSLIAGVVEGFIAALIVSIFTKRSQ